MPDYRKARGTISAIATLHLADIREAQIGTTLQRDALQKAFEDLASELRQNRRLEPVWGRAPVAAAEQALAEVASRLKSDFTAASAVADLPAVLRGEKPDVYREFQSAFTTVRTFFPEWTPPGKTASTSGGTS